MEGRGDRCGEYWVRRPSRVRVNVAVEAKGISLLASLLFPYFPIFLLCPRLFVLFLIMICPSASSRFGLEFALLPFGPLALFRSFTALCDLNFTVILVLSLSLFCNLPSVFFSRAYL